MADELSPGHHCQQVARVALRPASPASHSGSDHQRTGVSPVGSEYFKPVEQFRSPARATKRRLESVREPAPRCWERLFRWAIPTTVAGWRHGHVSTIT